MIIINADDWGRSRVDTDTALACYAEQRITSVSAMVFMEDSERAAEVARGSGLDIGLHLNFTEAFTGKLRSPLLLKYQARTRRFLRLGKYSVLFYNPFLRREFRHLYEAQAEEFLRLYGHAPSHVDGHQHMHLCANMLLDGIIPKRERVRRSFSFWPGEKGIANRTYRRLVDTRLARSYRLTDYFFDVAQTVDGERRERVIALAKTASVELMTHPRRPEEYGYLLGEDFLCMCRGLEKGSYALI